MADQTTNLKLPYILNAQAQKHVTHNEALRALDAVIQISVADRDLATPPPTPIEGTRFIVAAGATGAWAGREQAIAAYQDGAWLFYTPQPGWLAYIADDSTLAVFTGSSWTPIAGNLALLGINATADASNRLTLSSPASLFNHQGSDHRLKINKAAPANTASLLFQSNWSGRAEFGLTGDDNWRVKISPDGSSWTDALIVDRNSGTVTFPKPIESLQVLIAAGSVATINAPSASGLLAISHVHANSPYSSAAGLMSYDCGTTPALLTLSIGATLTNLGTTVPTGATGPVSRLNLAVDLGHIYIENRLGVAFQMCLTFINGYHA